MSGNIFINYRRGDDPGSTGWWRQLLQEAFAASQLFMDVDSIAPGLDFVRVLEEEVDKCDVFLVMIGPRWLDATNDEGKRRLDNPDDFVRIEIDVGDEARQADRPGTCGQCRHSTRRAAAGEPEAPHAPERRALDP